MALNRLHLRKIRRRKVRTWISQIKARLRIRHEHLKYIVEWNTEELTNILRSVSCTEQLLPMTKVE